jgi:hypothetical protein
MVTRILEDVTPTLFLRIIFCRDDQSFVGLLLDEGKMDGWTKAAILVR